jgi:hypothetical protein
MEVHHPHHPTHKKKWSEYLLEFLMLFVAVTLGFFAENIRENQAEDKKARELLEVVAKDFKTDIVNLKISKDAFIIKNKQCDTLFEYINLPASKIPTKKYYEQLINYNIFWMFNSNQKSRIEAEAKGLFFKKENSELAECVSRYNFFLKDYTSLDELMVSQSKICTYELIPKITDENIFPIKSVRDKITPDKIGVSKLDGASILRLKYLIGATKDIIDFYKLDVDSLIFYANKSIKIIENK